MISPVNAAKVSTLSDTVSASNLDWKSGASGHANLASYVLGFMRGDIGGVFGYGFVGKLDIENGTLTNIRAIDEERYNYLRWYKSWERSGFMTA